MKICHLTSAHPRHDTRIFAKQARSLILDGNLVSLIVADGKGDCNKHSISIIDVGTAHGNRIGRMTKSVFGVYLAALKVNAEIYHFHDPELIPAGLLLKLHGKTVIYDVHENYPNAILSRPYLTRALRRVISTSFEQLEKFSARVFDAVVPATPAIAKRFKSLNKNTVIIQNFPVAAEFSVASRIPWSERDDAVTYVGVISGVRGGKDMVNAMDETLKSGLQGQLVLAGSFSPQSFESDLKALPGWGHVDYKGYVNRDEMAGILGRVKAGLVLFHPEPNHVNAQPNKLFEYMSAGLPVIASDFPLWRDIVTGCNAGILVNPTEPSDIAEAIAFLCQNAGMAEKMGNNGKKAVNEKYNWDVEKLKLFELYNRILKKTRRKK